MRKRKMMNRILAFALAAAMALTGPAESMASVQAASGQENGSEAVTEGSAVQESETAQASSAVVPETQEQTGDKPETTTEEKETETKETEIPETETTTETASETTTSEITTIEETASETITETAAEESTTEETASETTSVEETTETVTEEVTEETTETVTEETTEEATEEITLSAEEKENAIELSVNEKKDFVLKKDEKCGLYTFTLPEDGVYVLKASFGGYADDCYCTYIGDYSGNYKLFYNEDSERYVFSGKSGGTLYFHPYADKSIWEENEELNEINCFLEIQKVEKGTVSAGSDGKYTLTYKDAGLVNLELNAASTTIRIKAAKAEGNSNDCTLSTYCSGISYGNSDYDGVYENSEWTHRNLDIDADYHIEYVLFIRDENTGEYNTIIWFDGTGMPFDISTKQTDKVGGELSDVTAEVWSISLKYELFNVDTAGAGGYIRYRKADGTDWIYLEIDEYDDRLSINDVDSETAYVIELVGKDKKTVYDSAAVTTKKYTGPVTAAVNENSITATEAQIDIKGLSAETGEILVQVEYTDKDGRLLRDSSYYNIDGIGQVTFTMRELDAETEYQNVKVNVWTDYPRRIIYVGKAGFKTKESSVKEEDVAVESVSTGLQTAESKITVKNIPAEKSFLVSFRYRRKGCDDTAWYGYDSSLITSVDNSCVFQLYNLSEADYELRINIDGTSIIKEYHHTPKFTGDVKPEIKIVKTFANAVEVECALNGADSKDRYTCHFEVCYNDKYDYWTSVEPYQIELDTAKPVKQQLYSYHIYPGETQRWRYRIYQNNVEYYMGYFESESKPLEVEFTSVNNGSSNVYGDCRIVNWEDVIKYYDEDVTEIAMEIQIRKKGQEEWEQAESDGSVWFHKDGQGWFYGYLEDMRFKPRTEYEVRLVSYNDAVVYGETSFAAKGDWFISSGTKFTYNPKTNSKQFLNISGNDEKPTVKVENENIVSVKDVRQTKIYLNIHNMGTTKLYITADGITKEVEVTVEIPLKQELFYLEGADTSLDDIASGLPENFKWVNGSESPKADNGEKLQYFDAELKETNADGTESTKYVSIPVAVGKLESIEIQGRDTVGAGKEGVYSVYYNSTGFDVNYYGKGKAYEITQKWTGNENLAIKGSDSGRNVTVAAGNKEDTYDLTVTVTVKNLMSGKTCEAVSEVKKVRVIGTGKIDNLIIKPAKEQPADAAPYVISGSIVSGAVIEVNYTDYDADKSKDKIKLTAETDAGQAGIKPANVAWESTSADILEVSEDGLVTIKGRGEGRIQVTAKDEGKYSEQVLFKIYDDAPVFEETALIVRHGNADGTRLAFRAQDGNPVINIKVSDNSQLETIQHVNDPDWYLRTKADSVYSTEKTESVTLEITTQNKVYTQKLNVTVTPKPTADKATAAFKQTVKPNLFFVDSEAVFEVSSSYEIEDIRTAASDKDAVNFQVKRYDAKTGQIFLTANKLKDNIEAYKKKNSPNAAANIEVKFKGYDDYVKFGTLKVAVQNKAVSLKPEAAVVTEKSPGAAVNVLSGKVSYDISDAIVVTDQITVKPAAKKEKFSAEVRDGQLQITYADTGTAKYTLLLRSGNWTQDIKLSGKITKMDVSKLSLKASKTKAVINTKCKETAVVSLSVKGNDSMPVSLNYTSPNDALKVEPAQNNKSVTISVDTAKTIKNGKYSVKVWGEIDGQATKKTTITITVTDKAPTVKLSGKGSINIANRELSGITYTASVKNTDAEISKVEITDKYTLWFSIKRDSGKKLTMRALSDAKNIKKNTKYPVKLRITLSNGQTIDTTVNVKPVNKLPRIKVSAPKKPTIDKNTKNRILVKLDPGKGYQISKVVLVNGKDSGNFEIVMNGPDTFLIQLSENSGEIKPKKYTLKYEVHFEGADNSKPVKKSIKVTVK